MDNLTYCSFPHSSIINLTNYGISMNVCSASPLLLFILNENNPFCHKKSVSWAQNNIIFTCYYYCPFVMSLVTASNKDSILGLNLLTHGILPDDLQFYLCNVTACQHSQVQCPLCSIKFTTIKQQPVDMVGDQLI